MPNNLNDLKKMLNNGNIPLEIRRLSNDVIDGFSKSASPSLFKFSYDSRYQNFLNSKGLYPKNLDAFIDTIVLGNEEFYGDKSSLEDLSVRVQEDGEHKLNQFYIQKSLPSLKRYLPSLTKQDLENRIRELLKDSSNFSPEYYKAGDAPFTPSSQFGQPSAPQAPQGRQQTTVSPVSSPALTGSGSPSDNPPASDQVGANFISEMDILKRSFIESYTSLIVANFEMAKADDKNFVSFTGLLKEIERNVVESYHQIFTEDESETIPGKTNEYFKKDFKKYTNPSWIRRVFQQLKDLFMKKVRGLYDEAKVNQIIEKLRNEDLNLALEDADAEQLNAVSSLLENIRAELIKIVEDGYSESIQEFELIKSGDERTEYSEFIIQNSKQFLKILNEKINTQIRADLEQEDANRINQIVTETLLEQNETGGPIPAVVEVSEDDSEEDTVLSENPPPTASPDQNEGVVVTEDDSEEDTVVSENPPPTASPDQNEGVVVTEQPSFSQLEEDFFNGANLKQDKVQELPDALTEANSGLDQSEKTTFFDKISASLNRVMSQITFKLFEKQIKNMFINDAGLMVLTTEDGEEIILERDSKQESEFIDKLAEEESTEFYTEDIADPNDPEFLDSEENQPLTGAEEKSTEFYTEDIANPNDPDFLDSEENQPLTGAEAPEEYEPSDDELEDLFKEINRFAAIHNGEIQNSNLKYKVSGIYKKREGEGFWLLTQDHKRFSLDKDKFKDFVLTLIPFLKEEEEKDTNNYDGAFTNLREFIEELYGTTSDPVVETIQPESSQPLTGEEDSSQVQPESSQPLTGEEDAEEGSLEELESGFFNEQGDIEQDSISEISEKLKEAAESNSLNARDKRKFFDNVSSFLNKVMAKTTVLLFGNKIKDMFINNTGLMVLNQEDGKTITLTSGSNEEAEFIGALEEESAEFYSEDIARPDDSEFEESEDGQPLTISELLEEEDYDFDLTSEELSEESENIPTMLTNAKDLPQDKKQKFFDKVKKFFATVITSAQFKLANPDINDVNIDQSGYIQLIDASGISTRLERGSEEEQEFIEEISSSEFDWDQYQKDIEEFSYDEELPDDLREASPYSPDKVPLTEDEDPLSEWSEDLTQWFSSSESNNTPQKRRNELNTAGKYARQLAAEVDKSGGSKRVMLTKDPLNMSDEVQVSEIFANGYTFVDDGYILINLSDGESIKMKFEEFNFNVENGLIYIADANETIEEKVSRAVEEIRKINSESGVDVLYGSKQGEEGLVNSFQLNPNMFPIPDQLQYLIDGLKDGSIAGLPISSIMIKDDKVIVGSSYHIFANKELSFEEFLSQKEDSYFTVKVNTGKSKRDEEEEFMRMSKRKSELKKFSSITSNRGIAARKKRVKKLGFSI